MDVSNKEHQKSVLEQYKRDANIHYIGILFAILASYIIAIFAEGVIGRGVALRIWPLLISLEERCGITACPFDSQWVSRVYIIQMALWAFYAGYATIQISALDAKKRKIPLWSHLIVIGGSIFFIGMSAYGHFDFQGNSVIYGNSVATSGLGIMRVAITTGVSALIFAIMLSSSRLMASGKYTREIV
jgi:hypothetical protein